MPSDSSSPLERLSGLDQSVWVDFLSRESIRGGHLQELIDEDSVVGATSNPTIFEKAMSAGNAYDEQLHELAAKNADVEQTFWALAEQDIRDACDLFRPVWDGDGMPAHPATGMSRWRSTRGSPTTRSTRSARRCASTRASIVPT